MSKHILIVEDEPATRALLSEIFRLRGHEVRTATEGFAALELIRERLPDVLVSDLHMPGMSGFELLSVVRRRLPEVFAVATSGAYQGDEVPEGIAADVFHPKATRIQRLVELVESVEMKPETAAERRHACLPVWTALCADTSSGEERAMLSCPECLRAIPQPGSNVLLRVLETECAYCKAPVQYAVVQRLDPATSQPFAG